MQNRIVWTKNTTDFKRLMMRKYHDVTDLQDAELAKYIEKLSIGCFVIVFEDEDGSIEPLVMHRFVNCLASMIAKENLFSLH
jgi:hypothetical protein